MMKELMWRLKRNEFFYKAVLWAKDIKSAYAPQKIDSFPRAINLLANDICNSKCNICDIWRQKLDFELNPNELQSILTDTLFQKVKGVGITGGEPTLRDDLLKLYAACCNALPNLKGMSIITNAIKSQEVINKVVSINEMLLAKNIQFSVMVSLDGYGVTHDNHRGRKGNFESAVEVINYLRNETSVSVQIGCTITKSNVYDVDELLDWMLEEGIEGRFRVGEFITRLYNNDLSEEIRNFDDDETYHLITFFDRLKSIEINPLYKRTYQSIISILSGENRIAGCPYQSKKGVVVSSKGEILYCAPKSKVLGSALKDSAFKIYENNFEELDRILSDECSTCIHDYHAEATKDEYAVIFNHYKWRILNSLKFSAMFYNLMKPELLDLSEDKILIFITGWYGTETVGDKAILGGIINEYRERYHNQIEFVISSLKPIITVRTIKELEVDAKVIDYYSKDFFNYASSANITVMGGGPLMEMNALSIPLNAFRVARKHNRQTVIFGCGIGPLYTSYYYEVVKKILVLATEIRLRDTKSVAIAQEMVSSKKIIYSGDPAKSYIMDKYKSNSKTSKKPVLACFLREWSREYSRVLSMDEYIKRRDYFEKGLAHNIKNICSEFDLVPAFYSMHTYHVGGDDRIFYRRFIKDYFNSEEVYLEKKPSTVDMIVEAMSSSSYNLCMRFHSVLFAHTLKTNFVAIDYTQGGKILGFLEDEKSTELMVSLDCVIQDDSAILKIMTK